MVEYKSLKVAVFEDERLIGLSSGRNGFSTRTTWYIYGVFKTAQAYGALAHAPGQIQSFNNPQHFDNVNNLRLVYPFLAEQIEDNAVGRAGFARDIGVREAQVLDDRILSAFDGLPHIVTLQDSENQHPRNQSEPLLLTRDFEFPE